MVCSGNGVVSSVPGVGCICDPGWTSLSDHAFNTSGPECLINHMGIRVLSYLCIIIPSVCNFLVIGHYISMAMRKKTSIVITREYKTIFPFCFLIMGIAYSIFGILKVAYLDGQQPLIGRDFSISFVGFICDVFCFAGLVTYLQVIIQFLEGYSRMMTPESRERVHQRFLSLGFYSWFTLLGVVIASLMPLISVAIPSHAKQLCMTQLILVAFAAITYGLIFCGCLSFLLKELHMYTNRTDKQLQSKAESSHMKLIVFRLKAAYYLIGGATIQFGIVYLIFGCSNFLFHLTTYAILIMYTLAAPTTFVLVITVSGVSQNESKAAPQPDEKTQSKKALVSNRSKHFWKTVSDQVAPTVSDRNSKAEVISNRTKYFWKSQDILENQGAKVESV